MLRNRPIRNRLVNGINTTVFGVAMILVAFALFVIEVSYAPSFHDRSITSELPKVKHSVQLGRALRQDAITITVMRDSKVFYGSDLVLAEDVSSRILQDLRQGSEPKAYLIVDARASYRTVKKVLAAVQSAGIQNIAFFAEVPWASSSQRQAETGEVAWDPESCWGCFDSRGPVATLTVGAILGIPLGLSGILRRRYSKLDASRRIYGLEE